MAGQATGRVEIRRPLEDVFELVATFENELRWKPGVVLEMTRETETSGLGARYAEVLRAGAGTTSSHFTVTSFEPNRLVGFTWASGTTGIYAFTAGGDATEVSFTIRPTPAGIRSRVGALVRKRFDAASKASWSSSGACSKKERRGTEIHSIKPNARGLRSPRRKRWR